MAVDGGGHRGEHLVTAPLMLRIAAFAELDGGTLYALLRLRVDVFVVEQQCAYPDLDGRDVEPSARHVWLERDGTPLAYLRVLDELAGEARIGRVVVAPSERGQGLARMLMDGALAHIGHRACVLDAQSPLVPFYVTQGFHVAGPEFVEDGIPHVPMHRPAPPHDHEH